MKEPKTKWISQQGIIAASKGFSSTGVGVFPEFGLGAFVFSGQIAPRTTSHSVMGRCFCSNVAMVPTVDFYLALCFWEGKVLQVL